MPSFKKAEVKDTDVTTSEYMNEEESEVIAEDGNKFVEESKAVQSDKMQKLIGILEEEFNLSGKDFEVTGYADKGNKIDVQLTNTDYKVNFSVVSMDVLMRLN